MRCSSQLVPTPCAVAAIDWGRFAQEIVPVTIPPSGKKGDPRIIDTDERPRRDTPVFGDREILLGVANVDLHFERVAVEDRRGEIRAEREHRIVVVVVAHAPLPAP